MLGSPSSQASVRSVVSLVAAESARLLPILHGPPDGRPGRLVVDAVLPEVPVRQWVLSLPHRLRFLCAVDPELCAGVRRILAQAVVSSLRRRCGVTGKKARSRAHPGAILFVQCFDSALRLNLHFHALCHAAAVQGRIAFGPAAGRWARRVGLDPSALDPTPPTDRNTPSIPKKLCANDGGFSLHARVRVHACARRKPENGC